MNYWVIKWLFLADRIGWPCSVGKFILSQLFMAVYLQSYCQTCKIRPPILRKEEKSPLLFRDNEGVFQLMLDCAEVFSTFLQRSGETRKENDTKLMLWVGPLE